MERKILSSTSRFMNKIEDFERMVLNSGLLRAKCHSMNFDEEGDYGAV